MLSRYVYLWEIKARIGKSDKEKEMEERITELERIAGIAQKGVIAK